MSHNIDPENMFKAIWEFPENIQEALEIGAGITLHNQYENIDDIVFQCAGINHMAFYLKFGKRLPNGRTEDLYPRLRELAKKITQGEDHYSSRAKKERPEGPI